jgi:hypothetical protein
MLKASLNRIRSSALGKPARASQRNPLFLAPPFTEDVVQAVRLISTRLALKADERSRLLWQKECNDAAFMEYDALEPLLSQMAKPKKILEIGPGLGRSCVVFGKMDVWAEDAIVHLYDADGKQTKYKQEHYGQPPRWPDTSSFCGNSSLLKQMLEYNGLTNYEMFDAGKIELKKLPGPYDLIYGFYSIGFHWSLENYLDDLDPLMDDRSVFLCTLNKYFVSFPRLRNYSTRILRPGEVSQGLRAVDYLALSKGKLPEVGVTVSDAYPD